MPLSTKTAYNHWLQIQHWDIALTLNYKPNMTQQRLEQANRHYWQRIDYKLFGQKQAKNGCRLQRAVFVEAGKSGLNWHVHAAVRMACKDDLCDKEQQVNYTLETFSEMLIREWENLLEAGRYSKATIIYDAAGWLKYISKEVDYNKLCFSTLTTHLS